MPPANRHDPKRAASSESQMAMMEFFREFPDDETCLQYLWRTKHAPDGEHAYCLRCGTARRFHRYKTNPPTQTWTCTSCSYKISPTAGTIFHKSSTSLQLWFYAMWIMTSTRCGVSAKQLERELGVTYKTAWRMFNLIRNRLMDQDYVGPLSGEVELDETFIGGRPRLKDQREAREKGWHPHMARWERKSLAFGAVVRGGRVRAEVVPHSRGYLLRGKTREFVLTGSTLYTDEFDGYRRLAERYDHHTIKHAARVYVSGNVHTQTIEGFWSLLKNGVRGTYHSVSKKWLQGYLNEYAWRYNHRDDPRAMFRMLLHRATVS